MAELVKPKRKKVKERKSLPIRYNSVQETKQDKDESDSAEIAETVTIQGLNESIEICDRFEDTLKLSRTTSDDTLNDRTLGSDNKVLVDVALPVEDGDGFLDRQFSQVEPTAPIAEFDAEFFVDSFTRKHQLSAEMPMLESGVRMIDFLNADLEQEITQNYDNLKIMEFTKKELEEFYFNEEIVAAANLLKDFNNKPKPEEDELFKLLTAYEELNVVKRNGEATLETLDAQLKGCVKNLWSIWPDVEFTQRGKCGHQKDVIFRHTYQQARANSEEFSKLQDLVANRKLAIKSNAENSTNIQLTKMSIKTFIWVLEKNCSHLVKPVNHNELMMGTSRNSYSQGCVDRLCQSLGPLFYFLRKVTSSADEEFVNDVKHYLNAVMSLLVRIGGWREHLLILAHILCCPPGVALWAAGYVQCPALNADHACALLFVLLQPIERRNEFLKHRLEDYSWSVVEDDGLELDMDNGAVCENVLFQLLDQIPFQNLFQSYLVLDNGLISEFSFLKLLGFFSKVVEIFQGGLTAYNGVNYRQLSKKLGKTIRNIMQLVADQLEIFMEKNDLSPRVMVEYDGFCIRCSKTLLAQPATWQFLATAPFNSLSSGGRWKIFWEVIHPGECAAREEESKRELCHLITTLCHLALAPGTETRKLVRLAAFHIFNVGFVYPKAWDSCFKDAQSALAALASDNISLLDELLEVENFFIESNQIRDESVLAGFWQALPIEQWIPNERGLRILSEWLMCAVLDNRSEVARGIFLRLNYANICYPVQKKIAWAILRASQRYSIDCYFTQICLTILCKLRLHLIDRNDVGLMDIPDAADDTELSAAMAENSCVAAFIALQTTSVGHFVPLIYTIGFKLVRILYDHQYHEAAFLCLDHLVTMFWDCPDSLLSCEDFQLLLGDIVTSNGFYTKVVKYLSGEDAYGPTLQTFNRMLVHHFERSGVEFLPKSVSIWLRAVHLFSQDCFQAVFILDTICRHAFINPSAWFQVINILESNLPKAECTTPSSPMSSWLGFRKTSPMPTILPEGFSKFAPWFAYAVISVEFEEHEIRNGLWAHFLQDIWDLRGQKINLDNILKKICTHLKIRVRTANQLAIYRWIDLALEMPENHALTIMVWQKIMELYLYRVPGLANRGSPGECFIKDSLKKQLLARLKTLEGSQPGLATTFQTFAIWLREQRVKDANLVVAMLPLQYDPPLLAATLNRESHLSIAILSLAEIKEENANISASWWTVLGRKAKTVYVAKSVEPEPIISRIQKRLEEFTTPQPLPKLTRIDCETLFNDLTDPCLCNDNIEMWISTIDGLFTSWEVELKQMSKVEAEILRNAGLMYEAKKQKLTLTKSCNEHCTIPGTMFLNLENWTRNEAASHKFEQALQAFLNIVAERLIPKPVLASYCSIQYLTKLLVKEEVTEKNAKIALRFFDQISKLWSKSEQVSPSTTKLIEQCLMDVGKKYLLGNPRCIEYLAKKIFSMPNATFLYSLFDPINTDRDQFVRVYKYVLKMTDDSTLVEKFQGELWIKNSLAENQESMISVIFNALREKKDINVLLLSVLNKHLQILTAHECPKNFLTIIGQLLQSVDCIAPETWYSVLSVLAPQGVKLDKFDFDDIFTFSSKFAVEQCWLKLADLENATRAFGQIFQHVRCNEKKTLYEHFGRNTQPVLCFLTTVLKSMLVTLKNLSGNHGYVLNAFNMDELFGPWLVPHIIAQDDVRQPFSADDAAAAGYASAMFTDLTRFFHQQLPSYESVLNFTLQFYLRNFCHAKVDGMTWSVIHSSLVSLPWYDIQPTVLDMDAMLRSMNQSIPLSHNFLGNIFASVDWRGIIARNGLESSYDTNERLHVLLLHLIIKVRGNASFKNNKSIDQLMEYAQDFSWHLLDDRSYHSATALFAMTVNPEIVLEELWPDVYDPLLLNLLQAAAGYRVGLSAFHPTTPQKRIIFVLTVIKCLATAACNRKRPYEQRVINKLISHLLTDIEVIVTATVPEFQKVSEACTLLAEILKCLSETKLSTLVEEAIIQWLKITDAKLVVTCLMQCAGHCIENAIFYGSITEAAVESYFANSRMENWNWLTQIMVPYLNAPVEHALNSNSYYLTLCLYCLRSELSKTPRSRLTMILQIFGSLKPRLELEPKLILLMALALTMISKESDAPALLQTLSDNLMGFASDRGGFISNIVAKFNPNSFSIEFKCCCAVAVAGICNVLLFAYEHCPDDKSAQFLEKAENSKSYASVMPCLLNAKKDLPDIKKIPQVVFLLLKTADILFDKNYFTGLNDALSALSQSK